MPLGILAGRLLGYLLSSTGIIQAGDRVIRAGDGLKRKTLMTPHSLTNIRI